ncbi:hypothetical protein [Shewanella marisflavi]|uniref:hypothetical protein n=1 Tax=Shewanella marisflavi TaxID=260364 RepID=UPI003AAEF4A5
MKPNGLAETMAEQDNKIAEHEKQHHEVITPNDALEVQLFKSSIGDAQQALESNSIPLFLVDRKFSTKLPSGSKQNMLNSYEVGPSKIEVKYQAATISDAKGNESTYYPSVNERLLIRTILKMCSQRKAKLIKNSNGTFDVVFRKNQVLKELRVRNKTRKVTDLNRYLKVCESSVVEVSVTDSVSNKVTSNKGTLLQNVSKIEHSDPNKDGLIRAQLHPIISRDILKGAYRQLEDKFLQSNKTESTLYDTVINLLRTTYLNATAKPLTAPLPYSILASKIFFANGNIESISLSTQRRRLNDVRKLMLENKVINDVADMTWTAINADDYQVTIITSLEWGQSQRRANAIYKTNQQKRNDLMLD